MEHAISNGEKEKYATPTPEANGIEENSNTHGWFAKRYLLAATMFLGLLMVYGFHANIPIAILEMTKNRTVVINETTIHLEPEFQWNSKVKGLVISMYAYGRLFSPLAAVFVKKIGGVRAFGLALFLSGIVNILHPFTVRYNFYLFLAARSIEGFIDIFNYVSIFEIWSQWGPKNERSKLIAITFTGVYVGTAVIFPLSGFLAHTWQWPSTFYFMGTLAIVISTTMLLIFSNQPSTDKYISESERKFLVNESKKESDQEVTYPWKEIFTSKPVWALIVAKFCYVCGFIFISQCLPLYVKDMTHLQIHHVGLVSGIPNVASIIAVPLGGCLADYLQNRNFLSATQVHKIYIFFGLVLAGILLFIVAVQTNFTIIIIVLIFFKILMSLCYLAEQLVLIYMAPRHASLLAALVAYSILGGATFTPMLIGFVVTSGDPFQWTICLSCLGTILLIGGLTFIFFGSSEIQPWSRNRKKSNQELNTDNLLQ